MACGLPQYDVVFHFAMPSSSPMYTDNPFLISQTIDDWITILQAAKLYGFKIVYASSSSLYNGNKLPFNTNQPIKVNDYYTECRYAIERLAELYSRLYGVHSVGLRLFSVYGPRERHKGRYANTVTQFLWNILEDKEIVVYGDGTQTRDFIYVDDVVEAVIAATKYHPELYYLIYNVGTGRATSFNRTIRMLESEVRKLAKVRHVHNPIPNYVQHTQTYNSPLHTPPFPKVTLQEGIRRLVAYYTEDKK